jgi:hypothetical protein
MSKCIRPVTIWNIAKPSLICGSTSIRDHFSPYSREELADIRLHFATAQPEAGFGKHCVSVEISSLEAQQPPILLAKPTPTAVTELRNCGWA